MTTPNMPSQPDLPVQTDFNDFVFTLKIPRCGELQVTLHEPAWNAATKFMRTKLPWLLAIATSSTIWFQIWDKPVPAKGPLPQSDIPTQIK